MTCLDWDGKAVEDGRSYEATSERNWKIKCRNLNGDTADKVRSVTVRLRNLETGGGIAVDCRRAAQNWAWQVTNEESCGTEAANQSAVRRALCFACFLGRRKSRHNLRKHPIERRHNDD